MFIEPIGRPMPWTRSTWIASRTASHCSRVAYMSTDKITDRVPDGATTALHWTTTDRMLADPSTKGMKHAACRLGSFDERQPWEFDPNKRKGMWKQGWNHDWHGNILVAFGIQQHVDAVHVPAADLDADWLKQCAVKGALHLTQVKPQKSGCHILPSH